MDAEVKGSFFRSQKLQGQTSVSECPLAEHLEPCQIHAAGTLPALANARTCSASKGIMWRKRNGSQSS